jgi:hypothetical protein
MEQAEQDSKNTYDSQNRTASIGKPERDRQNKITTTGQPGQDNQYRIGRNMIGRTGQIGRLGKAK